MSKATRKKIRSLERRIASLESQLQDQQQTISPQCPNVRPESLLEQAARDVQSGVHIPSFRVNLGNRTLFEEKNGSK